MTTTTKSILTSDLTLLAEDKTYHIPRAYFWIAFWLAISVLPWILVLALVDDAWWAFGPLFGNFHNIYRLITTKTVKFTMHANNAAVTHYNCLGGKVHCQTAVPMSNYEKVRVTTRNNYAHITFVKTDRYYDFLACKNRGCAIRCLPFEESYVITGHDAVEFATQHGFDNIRKTETA